MTEQTNTVKHQSVIVFTLMEDGSQCIKSLGENGDDEAEEFTDKCIELLREIISIGEMKDVSG